ncbi:TPA: hypothetical protein QDA71_005831 [Burkholderia vietnamiensis]|uniref:hypothetical protein n=1 Tax=Burkholderia vietnamiensis TaxID=60552 RepID=UPI00158B8871|nr:hypothetical protein [Burkholderia vietnamiensis]MBR8165294.1 hypothetical protein [Burkholderia vietnamiensis]MCA8146118.1 hypothetical protein [Burkholderia vietnamiensis]HDR8948752.1 hypothetical protein [Burkholderia vietnamiensis]HDR9179289.1 hypothetical protein [Burkholderia vietnamiensis]HDR9210911.1 hypothetical protein [Burkholderia vietnamiensis]
MASLFELLKAVKPRRVLLTTYTFSPEWFEATVYPLLSRQGCEQISVMLDNREARSSIKASVSRYGGNRYRIMSVLPRSKETSDGDKRGGGIFHPKIAYLETEDDDIALIASGNLTAAGQGHQMEVLDAVKASLEPEVFGELSGFFRDLPGRLSLLSPEDKQILTAFGDRAAQQAKHHRRKTGTRTAWLITTLRATAGEQFATLARQEQLEADALTVLSPFHDEDIAAVTRLRKKIGVERVRMALGKTHEVRGKEGEDSFIAPFADKVKPKKGELEFVTPTLGRNERPRKIHAKWFELNSRGDGSLMLTGSVNATPQSLWSLKNIEVSLARRLPAPVAGKWPQARGHFVYQPCAYPAPDAPDDTLNCSARIVGKSDKLTLEVRFSSTPPAEPVHVRLSQEEGATLLESETEAGSDDGVEIPLKAAVRKKLDERALWLTVSSGDYSATVWVNVEVELARRPGDYDFNKAIDHFDADDSDEYLNLRFATAFLDILGRVDSPSTPESKTPLNPPKLPQKKRKASQRLSTDDGDIVITGQEWLDAVRAKKTPSEAANSVMAQLSRAIARIMKSLDTPLTDPDEEPSEDEGEDDEDENGESDGQNTNDSGGDEAGDENEGDRTEAPRQKARAKRRKQRARLERQMKTIMTHVEELLDRSGDSAVPDELVVQLLPIKLNYAFSGSRFPVRGSTPPVYIAKELLNLRRLSLSLPVREKMRPLVACAGVAAAAAYSRFGQATPNGEIRSHIEALGAGIVSHTELSQWVRDGVKDRRLEVLSKFTPEELAQAVVGIAAAQPTEQRIANLVMDALTAPRKAEASADYTPEEKAMFEALRRRTLDGFKPLFNVIVGDVHTENIRCPNPKCRQPIEESNKLLRHQMLVGHLNCNQLLFLRKTAYADVAFELEDTKYVKGLDGAPVFTVPTAQPGPRLD